MGATPTQHGLLGMGDTGPHWPADRYFTFKKIIRLLFYNACLALLCTEIQRWAIHVWPCCVQRYRDGR